MTIEMESRLGCGRDNSEEALPRSEVVCSSKWTLHQTLAIRPGISFCNHFLFVSYPKVNWVGPRRNIKKVHQGLLDGVRYLAYVAANRRPKQSDDDVDWEDLILL